MANSEDLMKKIVSFAKRRGFVFPSSEIYGGLAAVYDYGPLGVLLANNVKTLWWKATVQEHREIVGLDAAIFMSPKVWEASGHVGGFSDPLVEDKDNHQRYRVDHLLEEVGVQADEKMTRDEMQTLLDENIDAIREKYPKMGELSDVKQFNLLVKSNLGDFTDSGSDPVYLRGETAQGIYVNYKHVLDSMRVKVPFGIAQVGKSFRNEVTARQFIFRTREFEQMEMQYFVHPDEAKTVYEDWKQKRMDYYTSLGISADNLRYHEHENLIFYAKEAYDIEYQYPFGWKELEGLHARGDYDLTVHAKHSGKPLEYNDQVRGEKYVPHIVETAVGVGRTMLMFLSEAYTEEEVDGETRVVLKFHPKVAPYKVAILPLSKKEELQAVAEPIWQTLSQKWSVDYDETQSIGKRYRRQDEIGTPYCVTVDFDTLEDKCVTVRDRDTMEQERIAIDELESYFEAKLA
ncbi:MAG: glycine--tRNA ligase [bacterium]|nr:glycine--tRNA ligase [bacterium]